MSSFRSGRQVEDCCQAVSSHPTQMEEPEMSPSGDGHEKRYLSSFAGLKVSAGITQPSAVAVFHTLFASFFES